MKLPTKHAKSEFDICTRDRLCIRKIGTARVQFVANIKANE